jgi:hypothetical protein
MGSRTNRRRRAPGPVRVAGVAGLGVLAAAALVGGSVLAVAGRAEAVRDGDRCSAADADRVRLDERTGVSLVCAPADGGRRWQPGNAPLPLTAPPGALDPPGAVDAGSPPAPLGLPEAAGAQGGDRCAREGDLRPDAATGVVMSCTTTDRGRRWVAPDAAAQVIPPLEAPAVGTPAAPAPGTTDVLPADVGGPDGLPAGVTLPAGTTVLEGSPHTTPVADFPRKRQGWITFATVEGSDPEAVHAHFVAACDAVGWLHDPARVERLPESPEANRSFDRAVTMLVADCRTVGGSPSDPSRPRPWYLAWGVTQRPDRDVLELVVEIRDTPFTGGR